MKWDASGFHTIWVLVTPMMLKVIETVHLRKKIWNRHLMDMLDTIYIQPGDKDVRFIRQMGP
jgi:hypothetical protein